MAELEVREKTEQSSGSDWDPGRFSRGKINGPIFAGTLFIHLGAIPAFFCFSWANLVLALVLYWVTAGLGICLCYHRLLTHRGFETPKWFEYVLAICGALTLEGGPIHWVSTHRYHHTHSDTDYDPHTPRHGFWWSHMLWFLYRIPMFEDRNFYKRYAPDLWKDRFYRVLARVSWLPQVVLGGILLAWGGWPAVFWGIFLRTVLALHGTWLVNSATHRWGYKNFVTKDDSKNLWWVALVSFGEGWHNNHHTFQRSSRHGLRWWEFDVTYVTIQLLSLLGLATAVQRAEWRGSGQAPLIR
jgi:stearoyl-CoA desaturase (delta-9 desaturase)